MYLRLLPLLAAALPLTLADVQFTSPAAGASVASGTISVEWKDSGVAPPISGLAGYQLFLMAGGNDDTTSVSERRERPVGYIHDGSWSYANTLAFKIQIPITPLPVVGTLTTGSSTKFQVLAASGPSDKNA